MALKSIFRVVLASARVPSVFAQGPSAVSQSVVGFSTGFVEVSALVSLLGGKSAETLSLGSRGAAGLAWAASSFFGAIYIARGCIAPAVSDSFRETLGLRNKAVDEAVGLSLEIQADVPKAYRNLGNGIVGVAVETEPLADTRFAHVFQQNDGDETSGRRRSRDLEGENSETPHNLDRNNAFRLVSTFDQRVEVALASVPPPAGELEPVPIHQFLRDTGSNGSTSPTKDWVTLSLSLVKIIEPVVLYKLGSSGIHKVTALTWAYFFVAACVLQALMLSHDCPSDRRCDMLVGHLPSPLGSGSDAKILLDMPANVRRHRAWQIVWAIGGVITVLNILALFVVLKSETIRVLSCWLGFQGVWMCFRIVAYHLASSSAAYAQRQGVVVPLSWAESSLSGRARVVDLMFTVSFQQACVHPRGANSYARDIFTASKASHLFALCQWQLTRSIPSFGGEGRKRVDVAILGCLGDTTFRSVLWLRPLKCDPMAIYDSVIFFMEIGGARYSVPCVRVLAGITNDISDKRLRGWIPRGMSNLGRDYVKWIYWVPFDNDTWLQVLTGLEPTAEHERGDIISSAELDRDIRSGRFRVSYKEISEVLDTLAVTRDAAAVVLETLKSSIA